MFKNLAVFGSFWAQCAQVKCTAVIVQQSRHMKQRNKASYTYHLEVDSGVLKDNESETEAKTNSGPRVHPLFVESPFFACQVHKHTHPVRNFLTKSRPYLNIKGPLFWVQSVRKFQSPVCSLSKFCCNYFTCKEQILCTFLTCKERTSDIFYAKSGCKLAPSFWGQFWSFKGDESETEAKINRGHRGHSLLVESLLLACTEHAQSLLFARYGTHTHTSANTWDIQKQHGFGFCCDKMWCDFLSRNLNFFLYREIDWCEPLCLILLVLLSVR